MPRNRSTIDDIGIGFHFRDVRSSCVPWSRCARESSSDSSQLRFSECTAVQRDAMGLRYVCPLSNLLNNRASEITNLIHMELGRTLDWSGRCSRPSVTNMNHNCANCKQPCMSIRTSLRRSLTHHRLNLTNCNGKRLSWRRRVHLIHDH